MPRSDVRNRYVLDAQPQPGEGLSHPLGLPVSTTHAKVSAICGAGRGADRRVMGQMAGAWALTFPVCGGVAFALTRLMMG